VNGGDLAETENRRRLEAHPPRSLASRPPPGAVGRSRRRAHRRCPHVDMALTAAKETPVTDPLALLVGVARVRAHV